MEPWHLAFSTFVMVVAIVGIVKAADLCRYYLDWRMRLAERQYRLGDESLQRTVQELRSEMAALKQHNADAVLSFDSTLHVLEARLKYLEQRALGEGSGERAPFSGTAAGTGEPARVPVSRG